MLTLLAVLILTVVAVFWGGRIRYPRSVARAAERVGDLDIRRMGTVDEFPDLHPFFTVAQRFDLSEEEVEWLKETAADPSLTLTEKDRARLVTIGDRYRDLLPEAVRLMEAPPRPLGFDDLASDAADLPGLQQQAPLARFLFLRAAVAVERGDDPRALETIRWLGWHASLVETGTALVHHLVGLYSESYQLRLIARRLATRRTAAELREMRGALSPHDVRTLYTRALAYELAMIRWIVEEVREQRSMPSDAGVGEWLGFWGSDSLIDHMGAGAANWILDYDDAYDLSFAEGQALLDYDPEEINFFEKVGLQMGVKAWWMPGRYRGAGEVRQLFARLLEELQDSEVRDCSDLAARLRNDAKLIRVDGPVDGLCRVRYASAVDYLDAFADEPALTPPLEVLVATAKP